MPQAGGLGREAVNIASTPGHSFGSDLHVLPWSRNRTGSSDWRQSGDMVNVRNSPFSQSHLQSSVKPKAVRYCHLGRLGH